MMLVAILRRYGLDQPHVPAPEIAAIAVATLIALQPQILVGMAAPNTRPPPGGQATPVARFVLLHLQFVSIARKPVFVA